jgi:hypothetical protein
VLLDVDGHIRITDFGLAKGNMDGNNRCVRTFRVGHKLVLAPTPHSLSY